MIEFSLTWPRSMARTRSRTDVLSPFCMEGGIQRGPALKRRRSAPAAAHEHRGGWTGQSLAGLLVTLAVTQWRASLASCQRHRRLRAEREQDDARAEEGERVCAWM